MPVILRLVGNDVVDLRLPANQASAANDRYRQRVLSVDEYDVVAAAVDPARALWLHWAAKESAYKALRRGNVYLQFLHRKFCVTVTEHDVLPNGSGRARGTVQHALDRVDVVWEWCDDWMHCMVVDAHLSSVHGVKPTAELLTDPLAARLAGAEKLSAESVAARVLGLRLLEDCGVPHARIQRGRRPDGRARAPQVVSDDGTRVNVLLSLSHDGRFAAAALSQATPRQSP